FAGCRWVGWRGVRSETVRRCWTGRSLGDGSEGPGILAGADSEVTVFGSGGGTGFVETGGLGMLEGEDDDVASIGGSESFFPLTLFPLRRLRKNFMVMWSPNYRQQSRWAKSKE